MEVPRLGVESELYLPVYTTATAARDPGCIYNLSCRSQPHQMLNPPSKARDPTCIFMGTGWVLNLLSHHRNS